MKNQAKYEQQEKSTVGEYIETLHSVIKNMILPHKAAKKIETNFGSQYMTLGACC